MKRMMLSSRKILFASVWLLAITGFIVLSVRSNNADPTPSATINKNSNHNHSEITTITTHDPTPEPAPTTSTQALIPLQFKFPRRSIVDNGRNGQPWPPRDDPYFDYQSLKPPLPFLVPGNVRLLSFKKPVSASSDELILGFMDMVTDGIKEDWGGDYYEMAPGVQWIQVDLGQLCDVYAIVIWRWGFNFGGCIIYHDTVVRCADDSDFSTGVKTLFNNDYDNSAGLGAGRDLEYVEQNWGKLIDAKDPQGRPARARFIRCYINGSNLNEMNRWIEVEVYGTPCGDASAVPPSPTPKQ